MRWISRLLKGFLVNPVGFALAALALLLPFVRVSSDVPTVVEGGMSWTGVQLLAGGSMHEDVRLLDHAQDGTVTREPMTAEDFYGVAYIHDVERMPVHVAGIAAGLLLLAGGLTGLLAGRRTRGAAGAVAAVGAVAAMGAAQYQALHHVSQAWADDLARNALPYRMNVFDPVTGTAYGFWIFVGFVTALALANILLMGPPKREPVPPKD
jgi:hypothetical protein